MTSILTVVVVENSTIIRVNNAETKPISRVRVGVRVESVWVLLPSSGGPRHTNDGTVKRVLADTRPCRAR